MCALAALTLSSERERRETEKSDYAKGSGSDSCTIAAVL